MWLRTEVDNQAFFPAETGKFRFDGSYLYGSVLIVEGPELQQSSSPVSRTISSTATSGDSGASASFRTTPMPPAFRTVIPSKVGKEHTVSVKIVKAKMEYFHSGKVNFEQISQMHIDLSEKNANVSYVLEEVQKRWGEDYRLVTIDGLQLEDCDGNQGWD